MESQERDAGKSLTVSTEAWRRLKLISLETGGSVRSVVDGLVLGGSVANPRSGWKVPATETLPAPRVSNLPARAEKPAPRTVPPAQMRPEALQRPAKDDEQARVARMVAAVKAMPDKPPIDPKDVHAGKSATAAARPDPDDVEF